jgi:hypothetical protein
MLPEKEFTPLPGGAKKPKALCHTSLVTLSLPLDPKSLCPDSMPVGSISERTAIEKCSRFERRRIIGQLRRSVWRGKYIRVVVGDGEPWYIPVQRSIT